MVEQIERDKRTQAERRAETRALLLASASSLFGKRGYRATSLEDIAESCGLTIRPIYYHFGNKRGIFKAVNDRMEQRTLRALACSSSLEAWESILELCTDPSFRQIILQDAPNVLGRDRWSEAPALPWSRSLVSGDGKTKLPRELSGIMSDRVALTALMEAAMYVIENGSDLALQSEAMQLISKLLPDPDSGTERGSEAQVISA